MPYDLPPSLLSDDPNAIPVAQTGMGAAPSDMVGAPLPTSMLASQSDPFQFTPPPPPAKKPSLFQRVHDSITGGAAPPEYDSMLTPQEIESARPGLISSLLGIRGYDEAANFRNNLNNILAVKQIGMGMKQEQRYQQIEQSMKQQFPALDPTTSTQDQRNAQLESMYAYLVQNGGRPSLIKDMGDVISKTATVPKTPAAKLEWQSIGGKTLAFEPGSTVPVAEFDHVPTQFEVDQANQRAQAAKDQHDFMNSEKKKSDDMSAARMFAADTKSLTDMAPKFTQYQTAMQQVRAGNVAAIEPLKYAVVQNMDTNAQMRQGILDKLEKVQQSIAGKAGVAASLALKNALPENVLRDMDNMVRAANASRKKLYAQKYADAVRRNPGIANYVNSPDVTFGADADIAPVPTGGINRIDGKPMGNP